ncbi:MAG: pilus assembly protein TadG-related protein [Candidatus Nucleicultricaceae bacterium]
MNSFKRWGLKVPRVLCGMAQVVQNERGGIAIISAFAALPLLLATALAIEYSRVTYVETRIKFAADAAAIAAARYDLPSAQTNATNFFNANFPDGFMDVHASPVVTILNNNSTIHVEVHTTVPAIMGLLLGKTSYKISTVTEVLRQITRLEVALVLDNTGSMNDNGKIQSLRTAATNFVDVLSGVATNSQQLGSNIYISLVPYVASVNIGASRTGWLSDWSTVKSSFPSKVPWKGCVYARTNLNEETDDTGALAKWPTYYTASTYVKNKKSYNDYTVSGNGTVTVVNPINLVDIGPNRSCGAPIVPLTNNYDSLKTVITGLNPNGGGGTLSNLGLVWGWRTISPNWVGSWGWGGVVDPVAYNTPNARKAVVIMTDGINEIGNEPSAYGLVSQGKLGTTNTSTAISIINTKTAAVCNSIKAQGIEVYTITFMATDTTIQNLFRNCATSPEWYFNAQNGSQLQQYFENIANLIQRIRVTV